MRISGNANLDTMVSKVSDVDPTVVKQADKTTSTVTAGRVDMSQQPLDNREEIKAKVKEIIGKFNEMLDISNNQSKFVYHEGLDKYYITVVNRETEEVVKEIPPKKLLDAYYEMQKMLGMIVDEKI